jgi:formate dehydrogenase major subunit
MVHPLVNLADVLIPSPAWYERSGHFCTLEGERRKQNVIIAPGGDLKGLSEVMKTLADKMNISLRSSAGNTCENIFNAKVSPEKARMAVLEEV